MTTTRKITIGDQVISAADSGGTLTTALTALAVLLNASTHPYFSAITWSSSATQIIGTADVAGCPFVFTASVTGGTGTCSNPYTVATASAGPNDWSTALNWSDGAVPVNSDTVIIKDISTPICWGLAQSAVLLTALKIEKSYTGKIGLDPTVFATTASGGTTVSTAMEYRGTYLAISATSLKIGENLSSASPNGSQRIKIDLGANASTVEIFGSASAASEVGRPAVRLLAAHASTDIFVRSCPGGFGLAVDVPGETSTVRKVSIEDTSTTTQAFIGVGVTITTFEQLGGNNVLQAAGTITTVTVMGGTLRIEGDFTITTFNQYGGTVNDNHTKTGGNCVTTFNLFDGALDYRGSRIARTVATLAITRGSVNIHDGITVTTFTIVGSEWKLTLA